MIDEEALNEVMASGRLGGFGLDVSKHEPLTAQDPLTTHARTVLTAHSAMASTTADAELASRSIDLVIAILAGKRPATIVNAEIWESPNRRLPPS